jgi:hypothetical protein
MFVNSHLNGKKKKQKLDVMACACHPAMARRLK